MSRPLITRPTIRPAGVVRGETRGERDQDLGDHRRGTADQGGGQQHREPGREAGRHLGEGGDRQQDGDQAALLRPVAERHQEEHADHVTDLGERDQCARGGRADREDVPQGRQQGLRVVQVGDRRAGGDGQQRDQPAGHAVRGCGTV
ncbi:hypothetical protein GCM10010345_74470 [Streptomyces canarius]|uniref:Uncharacterized protein n=1 Tax=Streptomyces canarius TaxID=285453 RepID=A0ABQ3D7Y6_9ACTN|nr:hypothetical protein GCM10010345_74470 [Streptomyces canarius]